MDNTIHSLCLNHAFHLLNKDKVKLRDLYYDNNSFKEEGLTLDKYITKELSHDFSFSNILKTEYKITHLSITDFSDDKIKKLFLSNNLEVDFIVFYQLEINNNVIYNQILPIKKIAEEKYLISSINTEFEYQTGHKFKVPNEFVKNIKQEDFSHYLFNEYQYLFVAVLLKNENELNLNLPKMNFYGDTFSEKRKEGLAKYNTYNFQQNYDLLFENKFIASSFQQANTKPIKQPLFIKKLNQDLNQDEVKEVNEFILASLPKVEKNIVFIPKPLGLPFCFHIEFQDGDVWSYDNSQKGYEQIISSGIKVNKAMEQIYVLDCVDNCFILTFNK